MAFDVKLTARAWHDLDEHVAYIHERSPRNSVRWRERIREKIRSLENLALSHGFAPENEFAQCEVRQLLFGQYRILYTVRENRALILTIRHGAQQFLAGDELDRITDKPS